MPKSRSSSIGNRRGDVTFDEQEMGNRIDDRLNDLEPVTVSVESRTRGRVENLTVSFTGGGGANVRSSSGRTYHVDVDSGTCDCPDHVQRHSRCRHVEAVNLAQEQLPRRVDGGSAEDADLTTSQITREHIGNGTQGELNNVSGERQEDAFFYEDHPDLFRQDMERVAREPIPYQHENALNGSDITFGIELEFVGGDSNAIAAELHQLGLCDNGRMVNYHSIAREGMWKVERDGSVTSGNRGGEIISPILRDTPETWRQIEVVCEVAKRHGARVNTKTGGHVHVGADQALDGKRQRWRRFFKAAVGFEPILHRLAGGEQGVFRGGVYAPSSHVQNMRGISENMPVDGPTEQYQNVIYQISRGKYQSINVESFANQKTIEFRAFNGTLTPGIIQANVKYAAGVIKTAERSRTKQAEGMDLTEQDHRRGRIINDYNNNIQKTDKAVMKAMDAIFSRREDKLHIMAVLARNRWE